VLGATSPQFFCAITKKLDGGVGSDLAAPRPTSGGLR